ncbi:MAG: hypothetical protein Tsb0014_04440 [Pleurocapsa sp.]
MSFGLKLELKSNNIVLVTNLKNNEIKEVTMNFLQRVTHDSLLMLAQYKYYELLIDTETVWNKVINFNRETERLIEAGIEHKFKQIMLNDGWMKITEQELKLYHTALSSWVNSYNSQPNKQSFDKFIFLPIAGGATAGALTYSTIGGVGVAAAGTAFGVGAVGLTALGAIGGLAVYGVGKAIL